MPKVTILPLPIVTNDTIKLCEEGTWSEMKDGCNVFQPKLINPGCFASIFSRRRRRSASRRRMVGEPEPEQ